MILSISKIDSKIGMLLYGTGDVFISKLLKTKIMFVFSEPRKVARLFNAVHDSAGWK